MYRVKDNKYTKLIRLLLAKPVESVIRIVFHTVYISDIVLIHKVCLDQVVK